jgi:hypothetical protein
MSRIAWEKRTTWSWILSSVNLALFAFHLYAIWVLAATFASGLIWWAAVLFLLGPPVCLLALIVSGLKPRQRAALILSLAVFLLYLVIWVPMLTHMRRGVQ